MILIFAGTSYEPPLTNVFTMQWFLTLFSTCLPRETVLRVWLQQLHAMSLTWKDFQEWKQHLRSARKNLCFLKFGFIAGLGSDPTRGQRGAPQNCIGHLEGSGKVSSFLLRIVRKVNYPHIVFVSNLKKHPGCDERWRVLQRHGAALQGDARVEQQGLQQTHQGEFQLE